MENLYTDFYGKGVKRFYAGVSELKQKRAKTRIARNVTKYCVSPLLHSVYLIEQDLSRFVEDFIERGSKYHG